MTILESGVNAENNNAYLSLDYSVEKEKGDLMSEFANTIIELGFLHHRPNEQEELRTALVKRA